MSFELLPFESIKDLLNLDGDAISDYPALAIIKLSVEAAIEEELGRSLELKARTETILIGESRNYVDLVGIPIASVSSVVVTYLDGSTQTLTSTEYRIASGGVYLLASVENVTVTVTYSGGLSEPTEAMIRSALLQVAYEYQNKENIGASSVSTDGGSVSIPALNLLPVVKNLLDGFKHPSRIS